MQRHVLRRGLEQLRNLRLRQPDRLVFQPALDARAPVFRLVEQEFAAGRRRGWDQSAHSGFIGRRHQKPTVKHHRFRHSKFVRGSRHRQNQVLVVGLPAVRLSSPEFLIKPTRPG